jgi:DNA-binding Xre family transcriptional regulator
MGKLCVECGKREMVYKNVKGSTDFAYKDFPSVKLETDLELLVCDNCGNIGVMANETQKVDEALIFSIKKQSKHLIETILAKYGCEQKQLASHIGITPEHLSQIKNGKMVPSYQTFNFLKTIAMEKKAFEISSPDISFKNDFKIAMNSKL